ncbi:MAG: helix-turn-helix domain-containing protein [Bdellovibrionaceae bacterium]|nr:helix-turn-helix domain-containing protein [Pseudobdellovibrionaceae bacterium]
MTKVQKAAIKKWQREFENALEDAGISQRKLAKMLGVHPSSLSLLKNGKREIKGHEAQVIALEIGWSTDEVIDFTEAVRMFT